MEKHQGAAVDLGDGVSQDAGHDDDNADGLISRQGRKKKTSMAWLFKKTGNHRKITIKVNITITTDNTDSRVNSVKNPDSLILKTLAVESLAKTTLSH